MSEVIRVIGVPALLSRFVRAAVLGEAAARAAQGTLAQEVASTARAIVPVDTGRLRDSIMAASDRVFTEVDYAAYVEYGTSERAPQPFLRPAADTANGEVAAGAAAAVMRGA